MLPPALENLLAKNTPRVFAGIAIAIAIVLFAPSWVLVKLGVDAFREEYRGVFGWVFILSSTLFAVWLAEAVVKKLWNARMTSSKELIAQNHEEENRRKYEQYLHNLTYDEKKFLAPYIFQDATCQYTNVCGGVYTSLLHKKIVMPPPSLGYLTYREVGVQEWAKKYLKEHQELLAGYEDTPILQKPRWH